MFPTTNLGNLFRTLSIQYAEHMANPELQLRTVDELLSEAELSSVTLPHLCIERAYATQLQIILPALQSLVIVMPDTLLKLITGTDKEGLSVIDMISKQLDAALSDNNKLEDDAVAVIPVMKWPMMIPRLNCVAKLVDFAVYSATDPDKREDVNRAD